MKTIAKWWDRNLEEKLVRERDCYRLVRNGSKSRKLSRKEALEEYGRLCNIGKGYLKIINYNELRRLFENGRRRKHC